MRFKHVQDALNEALLHQKMALQGPGCYSSTVRHPHAETRTPAAPPSILFHCTSKYARMALSLEIKFHPL